MATRKQRRIIRELEAAMHKAVQMNLKRIPEDWDGLELRWWLADRWDKQTGNPKARRDWLPRFRRYKNERVVKNL